MPRVCHFVLACALSWLGIAAFARAQEPELRLTAAPDQVEVGQIFEVRVEAKGKGLDADSIQVPKLDDFQIVGRSTQRAYSFQFGFGGGSQLNPSVAYVLSVHAVREGTFTIGPASARVGNKTVRSESVQVTVSKASGNRNAQPRIPGPPDPFSDIDMDFPRPDEPDTSADSIFLRVHVTPTTAYVGEQMIVSTRLYSRSLIDNDGMGATPPKMDGFWMQRLEVAKQVGRQEIGGRMYYVYELTRDAVFPLRAGKLSIGPAKIELLVSGFGFFSRPQRIARQSQVVTIDARPLPQSPAPSESIIVGTPTLDLTVDRNAMRVGDAATVTATASSEGDLRNLKLSLKVPAGLRVLSPSVQEHLDTSQNRLRSQQRVQWLVIGDKVGSYDILLEPVNAFDLAAQKFHAQTAPSVHVEVASSDANLPTDLPTFPQSNAPPSLSDKQVTSIPLRMHTRWSSPSEPIVMRAWFWPAAVTPWALLLIGLLFKNLLRSRQTRRDGFRIAFDLLSAAKKLEKQGNALAALHKAQDALNVTLTDVLGTETRGLSRKAVHQLLLQKNLSDELLRQIENSISTLDALRFSAKDTHSDELDVALTNTKKLVSDLRRLSNGDKT